MRTYLVSGFLLGASYLLWAQQVTILATRGDVQVEELGTWKKAAAGMKLAEAQKIRVGPQSYVALVAGSKAREVREPGTYTVGQILAQRAKADENPYAARYTGYVLNQAVASGAGRASGRTLGAVTRSASTMAPAPKTPPQSAFFADRVLLSWERKPGSEGYLIEILDEGGQVIHTQEVDASQQEITLDLSGKVKPGPCYYWSVSSRRYAAVKSTRLCFRILPADRAASLRKEEQELKQSLDLSTALGQSLLGAFYEQNGLYGYAYSAYQRAVALEPGTDSYQVLAEGLAQRATQNVSAVKE